MTQDCTETTVENAGMVALCVVVLGSAVFMLAYAIWAASRIVELASGVADQFNGSTLLTAAM